MIFEFNMQVSVIIVNYNVKHFLLQCLRSVYAAARNVSVEVFVVDNVSKDGSAEAVQAEFPEVKWIQNTENVGFSKANNQAMKIAQGEYVLILNPDTVVAEDSFSTCIAFMEKHADAGALGARMIDGSGAFLPESKRGLPTPEVAFYKMFGLSRIFPKSKRFGKYHLGYLDEEENNEVEILAGAFMFFRNSVLQKIGYFDETFFMYGEDIDLSWRVVLAGFKNYYVADTTIIHYKGESTKRGSLNYVKVFYEAMIIFAQKYFSGGRASLFSALLNVAIVFRAIVTVFINLLSSAFIALIDFGLIYAVLFFITNYWSNNIKYMNDYYPNVFLFGVIPTYTIVWLLSAYFAGSYEKPYRLNNVVRGTLTGTILIAAVYAFLPETWRFSRAIILLGAVGSIVAMSVTRLLYNLIKHKTFSFSDKANRWLIAGNESETERAKRLLASYEEAELVYAMNTKENLRDKIKLFDINEVIFCSENYSFKEIIEQIDTLKNTANYKILNPNSDALIGSNSKNTAGDLLAETNRYNLSNPLSQRKKRLLDIALCFALPFTFKAKVWSNVASVFIGKKTWIGYVNNTNKNLPYNKEAVFSVGEKQKVSAQDVALLNQLYAKHYSLTNDLKLLLKQVF
ncbi:MAG TPA: glycosyltransferase [Chitinophagales bacterium]